MDEKPKGPEKLFLEVEPYKEGDTTIGVRVHGPDCPRTKLEYGEAGGGPCAHAAEAGGGPAQVATSAYRSGYDRIFGTKAVVGQA